MAKVKNRPTSVCADNPFENYEDDTFLLINKRYDQILKDPISAEDKAELERDEPQTLILGKYDLGESMEYKPVGGGVSGAFLFQKTEKKKTFIDRPLGRENKTKSKFLKIYIDALTPKENPVWVKNTRAFREVRALELLSSYWYFQKLKLELPSYQKKMSRLLSSRT